MKIPALLLTTAALVAAQQPQPECQNVQVVSDGTFCIAGPVCGGTPDNKTGDKCPQVGDTAITGCTESNPSYDKKTGKCTAPVPADCLPTNSTGGGVVWACNWDLSKLPSPATTPTPAPTPESTPQTTSKAETLPSGCQEVSVVGDGTFCIQGPVCSGSPQSKGGDKCPQVGDTAITGCYAANPSFDKKTGKCTAPVPAECRPTNVTGGGVAWACNWDLSKLQPPSTPANSAPAPSSSSSTPCTEVSVVGDGTFCIQGAVCSGAPDRKGGDACPKVGDTAIADCHPYLPSYDKKTGKCTAPVPAECLPTKIPTGETVWACNWDLSKLPKGNTSATTLSAMGAATGSGTAVGAIAGVAAAVAVLGIVLGVVAAKKRKAATESVAESSLDDDLVLSPEARHD